MARIEVLIIGDCSIFICNLLWGYLLALGCLPPITARNRSITRCSAAITGDSAERWLPFACREDLGVFVGFIFRYSVGK